MAGSFYFIIFRMSIYRRRTQALLTAFWISLLVVIWVSLAPVQAGGQATYIIVARQSMEPNFHFGDLVIVHKKSGYQIGDVIAYNNADLGHYVIHRIIDTKRGRYLLKGDNNSWVDQYEPANQEVLGKLWIYLPKIGTYMQKLRDPIYMAIFAGLIGIMVATTLFVSKGRGKRQMEEKSKSTELTLRKSLATLGQNTRFGKWIETFSRKRSQNPDSQSPGQYPKQNGREKRNAIESIFLTLAVVAFLSLISGVLSFTRPATQMRADEITYSIWVLSPTLQQRLPAFMTRPRSVVESQSSQR